MKNEYQKRQIFTPYSSQASSQGYCNICYNRFDRDDSKPLLICPQDHCICKACLIVILRTPKCPFCRAPISINRIRINKRFLFQLTKKNEPISKKKVFIKTVQNQRIITQSTDHHDEQVEYLDPQQLMESLPGQVNAGKKEIIIKVCLIIELFLLQLPLGAYSLMLAMHSIEKNVCYDRSIGDVDFTFRNVLFIEGYMQFMISIFAVYFVSLFLTVFMGSGLLYTQYFLTLIAIMKSVLCVVVYHLMLRENYFMECSAGIESYALAVLITNYFEIALGLFIFVFACVNNLLPNYV